ncbi:MAG: hypothetical protein R3C01_11610 [Planctomycetaceae bacterium]
MPGILSSPLLADGKIYFAATKVTTVIADSADIASPRINSRSNHGFASGSESRC